MNLDLSHFVEIERKAEADRGPISLFALLLRHDLANLVSTSGPSSRGRWDVMVAAPWISTTHRKSDLSYFADLLKSHLGPQGLGTLSRIVLRSPSDRVVTELMNRVPADAAGPVELVAPALSGYPDVDRVIVIPTQRNLSAKAVASG
jgi:hypothetical protein